MSDYELSVDTPAKGYGHKEWSNPTNTQHRLYLHRFEGKHKHDCGHIDLLKKDYVSPKKSNRKADDIEYCLDGNKSEVVKATNKKNILDTDDPQKTIQHLASINTTGSTITVSYGNTVEVKSKSGFGTIQTQYPKLSMEVKLEGGSEIPDLMTVADNLVTLVESKLTKIINDMTS